MCSQRETLARWVLEQVPGEILYAAVYERGLTQHASVDIIKEVGIAVASTIFSEVFLQH